MLNSNSLFNMDESDCVLLQPDCQENELFLQELTDSIEPLVEPESVISINRSVTRRESANIESRMNSTLAEVIQQRIQTKALPLTMRKRLMYERACGT